MFITANTDNIRIGTHWDRASPTTSRHSPASRPHSSATPNNAWAS